VLARKLKQLKSEAPDQVELLFDELTQFQAEYPLFEMAERLKALRNAIPRSEFPALHKWVSRFIQADGTVAAGAPADVDALRQAWRDAFHGPSYRRQLEEQLRQFRQEVSADGVYEAVHNTAARFMDLYDHLEPLLPAPWPAHDINVAFLECLAPPYRQAANQFCIGPSGDYIFPAGADTPDNIARGLKIRLESKGRVRANADDLGKKRATLGVNTIFGGGEQDEHGVLAVLKGKPSDEDDQDIGGGLPSPRPILKDSSDKKRKVPTPSPRPSQSVRWQDYLSVEEDDEQAVYADNTYEQSQGGGFYGGQSSYGGQNHGLGYSNNNGNGGNGSGWRGRFSNNGWRGGNSGWRGNNNGWRGGGGRWRGGPGRNRGSVPNNHGQPACSNCHSLDHTHAQCPYQNNQPNRSTTPITTSRPTTPHAACKLCGDPDHVARDCELPKQAQANAMAGSGNNNTYPECPHCQAHHHPSSCFAQKRIERFLQQQQEAAGRGGGRGGGPGRGRGGRGF
jgi:hypothetical protein